MSYAKCPNCECHTLYLSNTTWICAECGYQEDD
jgi:ribosomal protein L37AE/L43A